MANTTNRGRSTTGSRFAGWIGYVCVLAGVAAIALVLTAAGGGFEGWTAVGTIVAVALIVVGAVMIVLNFRSRRLGGSGGTSTHEPGVL
ncbi:hypothetical protein [Rhodococcus sp. O3]|uniref:hypothetical protein n=1 Tax=Rhodococcus sp. O3 TaxID=3404919 RepID=UPI003B672C38